ncbi:MAG: DUF4476 domain-containing protein [Flavobacteriaceae bacterium]|nr:DUF4476 domain-containing protein [Flavobacteriaceae bacterium]
MKTITLSVLTLFFSAIVSAQLNYNIVIFTEDNSKFTLFLNNIQQHEFPESNVLVTNLNAPVYKAKLVFESPQKEALETNMYMPEQSAEITYIVTEKKGKLKMRMFSAVPLPEVYIENPNQRVIGTVITEPVYTETVSTRVNTNNTMGGVNMDVNVGGTGINVNVNVNDGLGYYEETTTTVVSGNSAQNHYIMQGYGGPIGCPWPMEVSDFQDAKRTVASKTWDETRLSLAKQIVASNCLFADQVRDIVQLMEWEETKLDFAKFAYDFTYDIGNYFKVSQAFEWEDSTEELNRYIANRN